MKMSNLKGTPGVVVLVAVVFGMQSDSVGQDTTRYATDVMSTLKSLGTHTWLVGALQETGLAESLADDGPYTLFAPTDSAVAAIPEDALHGMGADELLEVLRYHLLIDVVRSQQAPVLRKLVTVQGSILTVSEDETGVKVNGSSFVTADISAANGVIHSIDRLLMPPGRSISKAG